jgi:hypothetical protein
MSLKQINTILGTNSVDRTPALFMLSLSALIEMNIITNPKHNNYVTLLSSKQPDK